MQNALSHRAANVPSSATVWMTVVGAIAGLLSDVVASHLTRLMPAMENRPGLAIGLFLFVSIAGIGLSLYKERGTWWPSPASRPALDQATRGELRAILLPLMQKKEDRRALLEFALGDDPVYHQIDFDGAAEPFIVNMVELLVQRGELVPGKQALWALLEVTGERVGVEQAARIQSLRPAIAALSQCPRVLSRERLPVIAKALFGSAKPLPLALLGVLFVALASLVVRGSPFVTEVYAQKAPYCLPDRICVLVVRFVRGKAGADPMPDAFSDKIYDETDNLLATTTHERFTLKRLGLAEEKDGETRRRQINRLAREHGASLAVGISIPENQQGEPVADPMSLS